MQSHWHPDRFRHNSSKRLRQRLDGWKPSSTTSLNTGASKHGAHDENCVDSDRWLGAIGRLVRGCTHRFDGCLRRQAGFTLGHGVHEGRHHVLHRKVQGTLGSTGLRRHQQAAWRRHHRRLLVGECGPVLRRTGRHDGCGDRSAVRQQPLHLRVLQLQFGRQAGQPGDALQAQRHDDGRIGSHRHRRRHRLQAQGHQASVRRPRCAQRRPHPLQPRRWFPLCDDGRQPPGHRAAGPEVHRRQGAAHRPRWQGCRGQQAAGRLRPARVHLWPPQSARHCFPTRGQPSVHRRERPVAQR